MHGDYTNDFLCTQYIKVATDFKTINGVCNIFARQQYS